MISFTFQTSLYAYWTAEDTSRVNIKGGQASVGYTVYDLAPMTTCTAPHTSSVSFKASYLTSSSLRLHLYKRCKGCICNVKFNVWLMRIHPLPIAKV